MSERNAVSRRANLPWAEPVARPNGGSDAAARRDDALPPLVLDLDDGILPDSLGWELALCGLRAQPTAAPALALRAKRGADDLEAFVCALDGVDLAPLPLARWWTDAAAKAKAEGRPVIVLTARHATLAHRLREARTDITDVIVADRDDAVAELARAAAVRTRCPGGFVVPAEGPLDRPWARTAAPYEVAPLGETTKAPSRSALRMWAKALRLHQWAKNLLVFVPPILAGQAFAPEAWASALAAFLAFGLAASSTYLLNDLHDLGPDRAHRSKRHRPIASGRLPIPHALAAAAFGLAACAGLAALGGPAGLATVGAYLGLTLAYTFVIKRQMVLDTVTLAALFTLRLVGGIAFCGVAGSAWLLAFSMFVFTSLALGKRLVEIEQMARAGHTEVAGRGYRTVDGPAVLALGAATSAAAVLILSLFIVEASARNAFYVHPELLWAAPVALFIWLGRIWILCGRGELRDDPVEFALTDRASHALGLVIVASFAGACLAL